MCILTCVMLFVGCGSAKVEHNYLYSDSVNFTVCNEKKALTEELWQELQEPIQDQLSIFVSSWIWSMV